MDAVTTVQFEIHQVVGNEVEELDEAVVARRLAKAPAFGGALSGVESLEGAIVIEGGAPRVDILDDLGSAVQRLCFDSLSTLVAPGATYGYPHFTSTEEATLVSSPNGQTVAIAGTDVPMAEHPRDALLPALYACGVRYLGLLEELGRRGRAGSALELAHLRPFADRALDALRRAGFA